MAVHHVMSKLPGESNEQAAHPRIWAIFIGYGRLEDDDLYAVVLH